MENQALADARDARRAAAREVGKPKEALREFARSLETVPNRFRSLAGAAQAAVQAGHKAQARVYYRRLLVLAQAAEGDRAPLKAAREFLSKR